MTTLTVSEFAAKIDATPREARKFLRSVTPADEQPGKGGRWAIEAKAVRSLTSKFTKWAAERAATPEAPADAIDDADTSDAELATSE
jgi:hypothetical protein